MTPSEIFSPTSFQCAPVLAETAVGAQYAVYRRGGAPGIVRPVVISTVEKYRAIGKRYRPADADRWAVAFEVTEVTNGLVLAQYLANCLDAFDNAIWNRAMWYGRVDAIGGAREMPKVTTTETGN